MWCIAVGGKKRPEHFPVENVLCCGQNNRSETEFDNYVIIVGSVGCCWWGRWEGRMCVLGILLVLGCGILEVRDGGDTGGRGT